jgi:ketosteroid isomerase-like protein
MSRENVETVRRGYEHLSRTRQPLGDMLHPEVDFSFAWMDGRGVDEFRRATSEWTGTFEEWEIEAREVIEVNPNQVMAIVSDRGRPPGSEAEVHNEFAHLWTFRDGLAVRFEAFTDKAQALEAAGLEE